MLANPKKKEQLKGAQRNLYAPMAYRVRLPSGGTLVLCDKHLDATKAKYEPQPVKYTGDTFAVELCDHCYPEKT